MILLIRLLPISIGLLHAFLFYAQSSRPGVYPWLIAATPVLFALAGFVIGQKRQPWPALIQRLMPGAIALSIAGYGLLLTENVMSNIVIPLAVGLMSFLLLELLFLSTYLPSKYPVNGISHVNLSLVPVILWLASYTSVGLTVFINASQLIPLLVMTGVTAALFWSTAHVDSPKEKTIRWTLIGAWLGFHLGFIGALLPLELQVHGAIAAVLGALALRIRRYGITPQVRKRFMILEPLLTAFFLMALLLSSQWA